MPAGTYFAIGFGYTMIDTDMIIWKAYSEENAEAVDLWATEFDRPEADKVNNLVWKSDYKTDEELWEIITRRPLDTGDSQDAIIELDKELMMSYAFRTESAEFEKHDNVGHFTIQLKSDGQTFGETGSRVMLIERHGWWMWAAWMPVGLLLLFSKRYNKKQWKAMHIVHALLGHFVLWVSVLQTFNLLIHDNWQHKYRWDSIVNNLFILLTILMCISG